MIIRTRSKARREAPPLTSPDDLPGGGLGYALNHAANAWRAELTEALAPLSVTAPQFFALAALLHAHHRSRPDPMQRDVAQRTGMDANTLSGVVRGLERRGLLVRERHPHDSRAIALGLTAEGLEVARRCAAQARAVNRRFFAGADVAGLHGALMELAATSRDRQQGQSRPGA